jgi:hypothetical protein
MSDAMTSAQPVNPTLVLASAIVLPAAGHVLLRIPVRGLQFLFFIVILGWVTTKVAPADVSFVGRHAGGFLIYALSIVDAYRIARIRHAVWRHAALQPGEALRG